MNQFTIIFTHHLVSFVFNQRVNLFMNKDQDFSAALLNLNL